MGSFLRVAKEHKRDTTPLWDALLGKPGEPDQQAKLDEFVKAAWATTLDAVGSFLDVAKEHKRDTAPLWEAIESQPEKLAANAWITILDCIGSFFNCAKQHGRSTDKLEQALESHPDRLARKGMEAEFKELVGFAHYAPTDLLEIALRTIKPGHWGAIPDNEGMSGATWLIWNFGRVNRTDLAADLAALLLRRANWRDFRPRNGGFAQVCWLLANIPLPAANLVEAFLDAVCTERWLNEAYKITSCGQLASGLRQLALHETAQCRRRFHIQQSEWRLNNELMRFETAAPSDQSQIFQLLGCAELCEWAISQRSLSNITPESVSQLPLSILPHRPKAAKVEDHQLQLWLGLRAFVSISRNRLSLPRETIEETLNLWRVNLGETSSQPGATAHRVNQSMVAWLETCWRANPPSLAPSKEPLRTLVGFPATVILRS